MTDKTSNVDGSEHLNVSRRTVVKGAAWTVPAIMIATQAPAMAASPPVTIDFEGSSLCKIPGASFKNLCYDKGYVFWAKFENTTGRPVYLRINSMTVGGISRCIVGLSLASEACDRTNTSCLLLPAGTTYVGVFSNSSTDSSSTALTISFSWWDSEIVGGCGTAEQEADSSPATLSGNLIGGSWTTEAGGGSCKFPPGTVCLTPLTACGTNCATT